MSMLPETILTEWVTRKGQIVFRCQRQMRTTWTPPQKLTADNPQELPQLRKLSDLTAPTKASTAPPMTPPLHQGTSLKTEVIYIYIDFYGQLSSYVYLYSSYADHSFLLFQNITKANEAIHFPFSILKFKCPLTWTDMDKKVILESFLSRKMEYSARDFIDGTKRYEKFIGLANVSNLLN